MIQIPAYKTFGTTRMAQRLKPLAHTTRPVTRALRRQLAKNQLEHTLVPIRIRALRTCVSTTACLGGPDVKSVIIPAHDS